MITSTTKKLAATTAALTLVLGAAACGSSGSDTASGDSGNDSADGNEVREVTVGILPTVDLAPLMYAINEGLFEEHGLKVETRVTSGGSEAIPALQSGDVDFIFTSYIPVLMARQSGMDVIIASGSHSNTPGADAPSGVWTTGDSGIETMADLQGKTISVNALGSVAELLVVATMEELGFSSSDYSLLEIPFPEVPGALDQGRVDAAWVAEPSRTLIIKDLNGQFVGSAEDPQLMSVSETLKDFPIAGYGARGDEDPETLEAFHMAMSEAIDAVAAAPDIAREQAPEYTSIPEELLPELAVSTFGQVTGEDIERLQDLMVAQGMLDGPLDNVQDIVYTP